MAGAMAATGIAGSAIGSVIGGIGSLMTGQSQSNMYKYQAAIAAMNQQIAMNNASYDIAAGETQAQESGMQTRQQVGQTKAQQGAGNLDVNTGSTVQVRSSEEQIGEMNQATIRSNAAKAAYGEEVQAAQFSAQGQLDTMAASTSQTAGELGFASSIIGGVASVGSKWSSASSAGILNL